MTHKIVAVLAAAFMLWTVPASAQSPRLTGCNPITPPAPISSSAPANIGDNNPATTTTVSPNNLSATPSYGGRMIAGVDCQAIQPADKFEIVGIQDPWSVNPANGQATNFLVYSTESPCVNYVLAKQINDASRGTYSTDPGFSVNARCFGVAVVQGGYGGNTITLADVNVYGTGGPPPPPPPPPPGMPVLVVIIPGQSNATNQGIGSGYASSQPNCQVINMSSGALTPCSDPVVPSVVGNSGVSFVPRLGDLLMASGKFSRVVLAPIAVGGTYTSDWIPGGMENGRLAQIAATLNAAGLTTANGVKIVTLYMEGEGDGSIATSQATYTANVRAIEQTLENNGIVAPFIQPLETVCNVAPVTSPSNGQATRAAQGGLVDYLKFWPGADLDAIGPSFRQDGCHFAGPNGTALVAQFLVQPVINAALH